MLLHKCDCCDVTLNLGGIEDMSKIIPVVLTSMITFRDLIVDLGFDNIDITSHLNTDEGFVVRLSGTVKDD